MLDREDEYLVNMQHTVIPSWYQREGYIKAMANLIQSELGKFGSPSQVDNLVSARLITYVELFSSGKKELQVFCSFSGFANSTILRRASNQNICYRL